MAATILHADLDSFYASVEQRDKPRLRNRPILVGSGVVLAASYEAKAYGVKTPMRAYEALRLCPQAIVVEPRFSAYAKASRDVFAVFERTTPIVEGLSIDEAFLEVGGLGRVSGTPLEIASQLRNEVRDLVGLPISVGIARTKFLAKVASAVSKPDGLLLVDPAEEREFLWPLRVGRLWGVGPVTAQRLNDRGIYTVEDLARVGEAALVAIIGGASGRHLNALAHGRDPRPVERQKGRRSIGAQMALGRNSLSGAELQSRLIGLTDRVTRRMRRAEVIGRTVTLSLRFDDKTRSTRSHSVPHGTASTETISTIVRWLFQSNLESIEQRGVTLVGLAVSNLSKAETLQLSLPFSHHDNLSLDRVLDQVHSKFGGQAVSRTSTPHPLRQDGLFDLLEDTH